MKYVALVARREYVENARTRGFWIGLMLFPLMVFLMIQVPVWLQEKIAPVRTFVLVDQSGGFEKVVESALEKDYQRRVLEGFRDYTARNVEGKTAGASGVIKAIDEINGRHPQALETFINHGGAEFYLRQLQPSLKPGAPPFREPRRRFQRVALPSDIIASTTNGSAASDLDLTTLGQNLKPYLRGQKKIDVDGRPLDLSAAILIPRDIEKQVVRPRAGASTSTGGAAIQYWSVNVAEANGLKDEVERAVNQEIRHREYLARGMDAAAISDVERTYAPFVSLNPKKEAGRETVSMADKVKQWAPSGFVYLLWVSIFTVSQMLLGNIIEEKSNRIIEVLLSSVTPGELMMGKLFGIAAVGLSLVGAWMLSLFCILSWKAGGVSDIAGQILGVLKTSNMIPMFYLYFLLGYLLYAGVILSIGSVCNTLKEAQSYMGVITMAMMVPLLTMTYIPNDPNGIVARVMSWVPIYTPFAMMNRAAADPPLVDLIGTFVLLVASTITVLWMAGKIFRIGILRTGQPPKILEMIRWIKG
ncbi:MAG TPA: ABC transporter permease [Verrucomicrobiae bacterium]|nr:ABC transporter permease [Verrucomicrobiae bacterium]